MKKEIDGVVFREDSRGAWMPESSIKPQDILKDDLVENAAGKIVDMRDKMKQLNREIKEEIRAYIDLIGEKYGVKLKGSKGNITLTSYDGKTRIVIGISESIYFVEKLWDRTAPV